MVSLDESPPSRAAWIEMYSESVPVPSGTTSPPSRAAWIEMKRFYALIDFRIVAAFTGGVD